MFHGASTVAARRASPLSQLRDTVADAASAHSTRDRSARRRRSARGAEVADAAGAAASVTCSSRIDTYDGEFLLAGDLTAGGGGVDLGRMSHVDYPSGTLLALGAVGLPRSAPSMVIVLRVQGVRARRAAR